MKTYNSSPSFKGSERADPCRTCSHGGGSRAAQLRHAQKSPPRLWQAQPRLPTFAVPSGAGFAGEETQRNTRVPLAAASMLAVTLYRCSALGGDSQPQRRSPAQALSLDVKQMSDAIRSHAMHCPISDPPKHSHASPTAKPSQKLTYSTSSRPRSYVHSKECQFDLKLVGASTTNLGNHMPGDGVQEGDTRLEEGALGQLVVDLGQSLVDYTVECEAQRIRRDKSAHGYWPPPSSERQPGANASKTHSACNTSSAPPS